MKLSIIITVFNKEQFIERCLQSCINQLSTQHDLYEILVINDGSTDNSKVLIEKYLTEQDNIRLISQDNMGLSIARNNGVKEAKGEYVWFVDADDYIVENAVALILEASANSPDVIPIQSKTEDMLRVRNSIPVSAKDGKAVLLSRKWAFCSPFYIYRRSFLIDNTLWFYPGIYHEDAELTPRLLYYAHSVSVVPQVLYIVFHDPNSITQVPKIKRADDYVFIADRLFHFKTDIVLAERRLARVFDYIISEIINNALYIICKFDSSQKAEFDRKLYQNRSILSSLWRAGHVKYRMEYVLFRVFPKRYSKVYEILRHFA